MRILIAEDDPTSHRILKTILDNHGYTVEAYTDGADALAALSAEDAPKIAILDWMMPSMDGVEVVRELRSAAPPSNVYIILLTAKTQREDVVYGLETGADDYITKPFDLAELHARIHVGVRIIELQSKLARNVEKLENSLSEIKALRGLIPICASCKKIRDDDGFWREVESYIAARSEAEFSHGICPDCIGKYYPDYVEDAEPK